MDGVRTGNMDRGRMAPFAVAMVGNVDFPQPQIDA
jgi:hypothetical protein